MSTIIEISPADYHKLAEREEVILCDIREPDEHNRERIDGALNVPLSSFHHEDLAQLAASKHLIFHCQSGNRTKMNAAQLANVNAKQIYILSGGLQAWQQAGYSTLRNSKAPLPLMRQVQLIAGSLVLLGVLLAYLVHPAFMLISAFVGAGLFVAGSTGFCGMANILILLPYNKQACQVCCKKQPSQTN